MKTERLVKTNYRESNFNGCRLSGAKMAGLRCHLVVGNVKNANHTCSPTFQDNRLIPKRSGRRFFAKFFFYFLTFWMKEFFWPTFLALKSNKKVPTWCPQMWEFLKMWELEYRLVAWVSMWEPGYRSSSHNVGTYGVHNWVLKKLSRENLFDTRM